MTSTARRAVEVACEWHVDQWYGKHPYIVHLDDVARLCRPFGETAEIVAYLHDILEDTKMPASQLEEIFGLDVRLAVELLTDPPGNSRKERKAGAYAKLAAVPADSPLSVALLVKAADRLANVRASVDDNNESLLDMYRKEHPAFVRAVRRIGHGNEAMIAETTMLLALPTGGAST